MIDLTSLLPLVLALACGGAIGFERRWRGHAAGPHTNAMVAMGSAVFVMAGQGIGGEGAARVAAQVATGIGFLAGGVILRDGLNVRGLNTAATVWCVAGIGILAGLGRLQLAAGVTALTVVANSLFHILEHRVDRLRHISEIERPRNRREKQDGL